MNKNMVPKQCYDDFGPDLEGCITQQNEGCYNCKLYKEEFTVDESQIGKLNLDEF